MRSRTRRTAEELEALLEGRLSAKDAGREARQLATLASTLTEEQPGPVATLADDRRLLLRDRILDDIAALEAPSPERVPAATAPARRRPTRAAIASGLASTMIAATGVTVAAQEALPGDALYGLKKGTESVRMNLASDATQAARLELRFAEERLEEIAAGAGRLPAPALIESLAEMDQRSMTGAQQLVLDGEQTGEEELLLEVDEFLERQSAGIVEVFPRLPVQARPHAEDSLAMLREIRSDLLVPALEACDCVDIVPAGYGENGPVRRATSEPLPPAPADEQEPTTADEPAARDGDDEQLRDPVGDITPGDTDTSADDGGVGTRLLDPLGETGEEVGSTVDDTVDDTTDAVEDTADEVDETVEELGDTADTTTDSVGDLLGSATDTGDELLGR